MERGPTTTEYKFTLINLKHAMMMYAINDEDEGSDVDDGVGGLVKCDNAVLMIEDKYSKTLGSASTEYTLLKGADEGDAAEDKMDSSAMGH
jgi:hypothetical protein